MESSSPRFKAKELAWLLVPVIALAGLGAYLTQGTLPFSGQWLQLGQPKVWSVVVHDVKMEPVTPREVALGYDTKVVIYAHERGKPPAPPTGAGRSSGFARRTLLVAQRNGQRVNLLEDVPIAQRPKLQASIGGVAKNIILMKLATIPPDLGQIDLEAELLQMAQWQGPNGIVKFKAQTSPVVFTVRRAGERVQTPVVSKDRPFVVKKFAVDDDVYDHPHLPKSTGAVLEVVYTGGEQKKRWPSSLQHDETYIIDERGRKHKQVKLSSGAMQDAVSGSPLVFPSEVSQNDLYRLLFHVATFQIPASAGKLTLHTRVSMDDCWPLDLSLVVRDK